MLRSGVDRRLSQAISLFVSAVTSTSQAKTLHRVRTTHCIALADGVVYFHKGKYNKSTVSVLSEEVYAAKTVKPEA